MYNSNNVADKIKTLSKPGNKLFFIDEKFEPVEPVMNKQKGPIMMQLVNFINAGIVDHITISESLEPIYTICTDSNEWIDFFQSDFGKTIFISEKEAKNKLTGGKVNEII